MSPAEERRDLIVLVADKDMESALEAMVKRHKALGIRPVTLDIRRHPEKDCGCRTGGIEFLSAFANQYEHALLMFDLEGCGVETRSAQEIENEMEESLRTHWGVRSAVIVIAPELDIWVWSDSPHVDDILGWSGRTPDLRSWLVQQGFLLAEQEKPIRPKEAMEKALYAVRKPRSSSIYQALAEKVSLARCRDRAFMKFKETLRKWFQEEKSKA